MTNYFLPVGTLYIFRLFKLSFVICFFCLGISSCTVSKTGYYFKDIIRDTTIAVIKPTPIDFKIKKGDVISVTVSSLSRQEDEIYNALINTVKVAGSGEAAAGSKIDEDGNIFIHKIGKIKAEGLTKKELKILTY